MLAGDESWSQSVCGTHTIHAHIRCQKRPFVTVARGAMRVWFTTFRSMPSPHKNSAKIRNAESNPINAISWARMWCDKRPAATKLFWYIRRFKHPQRKRSQRRRTPRAVWFTAMFYNRATTTDAISLPALLIIFYFHFFLNLFIFVSSAPETGLALATARWTHVKHNKFSRKVNVNAIKWHTLQCSRTDIIESNVVVNAEKYACIMQKSHAANSDATGKRRTRGRLSL